MNNHTSSSHHYSGRLRSRNSNKPVYTTDKRAKFTQRESKKWIRFITVLGYIFFVSLPAVSLSVYYVYIWDPGYIKRFPTEAHVNRSLVFYKPSQRNVRDLSDPIAEALNFADSSQELDTIHYPAPGASRNSAGTGQITTPRPGQQCTCQPSPSPTTQNLRDILKKNLELSSIPSPAKRDLLTSLDPKSASSEDGVFRSDSSSSSMSSESFETSKSLEVH